MNQPAAATQPDPAAVYCPRCGRPMLIAPQHAYSPVACPHCGTQLEPWRVQAASREAPTMSYGAPPRSPATVDPETGLRYSPRNRWVAGALGILLGALGVHRFYLGFTGIGILMVVLCVCTAGIVTGIWGFIEGILCFCGAMRDAEGRTLSG